MSAHHGSRLLHRGAVTLACGALVLLAGCGSDTAGSTPTGAAPTGSGPTVATPADPGVGGASAPGAIGGAPLMDAPPAYLTQMEDVHDETHFSGRRVIWSRRLTPGNVPVGGVAPTGSVASVGGVATPGQPLPTSSGNSPSAPGLPWDGLRGVSTRQDVSSDGNGRFAIELVDMIQLPSGSNEFVFPLAFEASVDARWHVREFRVRDASLVMRNYTVVPSTATVSVAGIPCETMVMRRLAPIADRPGHYELDVDPTTGFTLAMREFDAQGRILQGFVYEEFAYGADLSAVPLRSGGRFAAQEIDLESPLVSQIGFRPLVPDVFPAGFELIGAARFEIPAAAASGHGSVPDPDRSFLPAGPWVRFDASDGIELVRFAHGRTEQVDDPDEMKSSVLRTLEEGSWSVAFGFIRGVSLVISGRVGVEELRLVVESAF